jgi:hypothetical protein
MVEFIRKEADEKAKEIELKVIICIKSQKYCKLTFKHK